jgi:AcrR family transcriptional regulator
VQGIAPRERQRRESWRALQSAAVRLVGERGFAAVTVDDVAAAAGVSRRTFFNHFPTKAAALFDPDPEDADRFARLLTEADGAGDLWGALRGVWLGWLEEERVRASLAVRRRLVEDPELAAYQRAAYRFVEVELERWSRRQRPDDPFAAALAVNAAAAVVGTAFLTWRPDAAPSSFLDLIGRGFDQLAGAFPARRRGDG